MAIYRSIGFGRAACFLIALPSIIPGSRDNRRGTADAVGVFGGSCHYRKVHQRAMLMGSPGLGAVWSGPFRRPISRFFPGPAAAYLVDCRPLG